MAISTCFLILLMGLITVQHLHEVNARASGLDNNIAPWALGHLPRDCLDLLQWGYTTSGVYTVYVGSSEAPLRVYCDMENGSGGWLVFQKRFNGSVEFRRKWSEYQTGFGHLDGGEFWLGNTALNQLTQSRSYELQIRMTDHESWEAFAQYSYFSVGAVNTNYQLTVTGYSGTAGDSLKTGRMFSTYDDENAAYCSARCGGGGGFWYGHTSCSSTSYFNNVKSSLNGNYTTTNYANARSSSGDQRTGIYWQTFRGYYYSLKKVQMAIRPAP